MDEDGIQLILKQYNSKFASYVLSLGIYTIKDIAEVVYTMGDHDGTLKFEYDDNTTKTKLILTRFGSTFGTLRFAEKDFFNTLLSFAPYWHYRPTYVIHADSPAINTTDKNLKSSTLNKIHLKCDIIDGSVINGISYCKLFSFLLDHPAGYKVFSERDTIYYRKINKPVLNTITFYLEVDNHEEVNFIGKTLTFTSQLIKI